MYEVILNLLKGNNHLRKIAKEIDINHMTVKRILDGLIKNNILDVKVQGRNNIFSIKKTIEAKNSVLISEIYKFDKLIKFHPELKKNIREIQTISDDIILIFGSYAKFIETHKSDIDIYINTSNSLIKKKIGKINKKFSVKIGKYDKNSLLIKEIEKNHIVVKGVEYFYEKNKFFNET